MALKPMIDNERWNIDIWVTNEEHIQKHLDEMNILLQKMNDESRNLIIRLKTELIERGQYGRHIFSVDIYEDVTKHGIRSIEDLDRWHSGRGII